MPFEGAIPQGNVLDSVLRLLPREANGHAGSDFSLL
jgi:hypothetical protein